MLEPRRFPLVCAVLLASVALGCSSGNVPGTSPPAPPVVTPTPTLPATLSPIPTPTPAPPTPSPTQMPTPTIEPSPTQPAEAFTVTGYIYDSAGHPVAGAMVYATREDDEFMTLYHTAGADGFYRIDVNQAGFGATAYCMSVAAPSSAGVAFGPSGWTINRSDRECVEVGQAPRQIDVSLPDFTRVDGRVIGSNGTGCSDRRVFAEPVDESLDSGRVVEGDGQGNFTVFLLPAVWTFSLFPGGDDARTNVDVGTTPIEDVRLRLNGPC